MKKIYVEEGAAAVIGALEKAGFEAYAVGGCVRDSLLGKVPKDWDITTSARPEQIKEIFPRTFDTGIRHGTVSVREQGNTYEVTTYRIDGDYGDHRRPDQVEFTDSLREDLARRDFTINAMAYHPRQGLADYFGGADDLILGRIRCVGDPRCRFEEDALRMLRALRFSARLGFDIEEKTYKAIREKAYLLKNVSKERIQEELNQILLSEEPDRIRMAAETGLMEHCLSVFEEDKVDYKALNRVLPERVLRWAVLLQGLNPVQTEDVLRDLKFDNDSRRRIVRLAQFRQCELPEEEEGMRRFLHDLGRCYFEDLYALKKALEGETSKLKQGKLQYIAQKDCCLQINELAVGGEDLRQMGVEPGPRIGRILELLLDRVLAKPELNERRDTIMELAAKILKDSAK